MSNTHLAIAITMAMMEQDQSCLFFPATALVQLLQKAKASYELPALLQKLDSYALPGGDRRHLLRAPERAGDLGAV
ncbi:MULTISPECIES: ATP-binding protein [Synechococcales]|uniref:ATP-binding protein n=1 Tax=Synechococcales TaxID=1890424 RepID=UPI00137AB9CB|nr:MULTISPECIES: ATP-binding protein [Cyanobium]MCP9781401.1 ATP-binding protein [Cyanobium sp. To12R1]MCP9814744.1 ATP-binding protein [Synechococcus lacustris L1E-Slac]